MSKGKQLVSLGLILCLSLGLVSAAWAAADPFPAVNTYTPGQFADVAEDAWYADAAKLCYETGLMTGTNSGFEPGKTLTIGECAALTARIREALTGEAIVSSTPLPGETKAWYTDYVNYMARDTGLAAILSRPTEPITRGEFFLLACAALSAQEDLLTPINSITALPDTDDANVLSFYNAGVLTGVDGYGTFNGGGTLTRMECAAMVARIIDPSLRKTFTPEEKPEQTPALDPEEELMRTEAVRVNGSSVNFSQFIQTLNECIYDIDASLQANSGKRLDWNTQYSGIDDLPAYFKEVALSQVVEDVLVASQARALGCGVDDLPAFLTPDPGQDLSDIYCAKHILVDDEQTAKTLIATLMASPSIDTFDRLLGQYGTDPGMVSSPNGYLFTDGDMVAEFENAVKALNVGSCSTVPVKSQFGYHVILRLDPTSYPGWQREVQSLRYEDYVDQWFAAATVTPNTAELDRLDVPGRYQAYLASLGG